MNPLTRRVLSLVAIERVGQDTKWRRTPGVWPVADDKKLAVLVEEVGEVARAILDCEGTERLFDELVQVAAVATAWAECIITSDDARSAAGTTADALVGHRPWEKSGE